MKISSRFFLAAAFALISPLTPVLAQGSADDTTFQVPLPAPEPIFDYFDEDMLFGFTLEPGAQAEDVLIALAPPGGPGGDFGGGSGGPGGGFGFGPGGGPGGRGGPKGHCPMGFGGGPFGMLTGELALKDDQLEKLHAIKNQMMDATGVLEANLASYHRQLRDVLSATTLDRAKATAIQSKINDTKASISNARLSARMDSHAVLTDEQRKALHDGFLKGGSCGMGMRARFHRRF